jgi:protein-tyrosine phosphatase
MNINKIIVLCTGNICRSPIAEIILKEALQSKNITVFSAGIAALVGSPADPKSVEIVLQKHGLDLSGHRAQQVNSAMLRNADLILALDQTHKTWTLANHPHLTGRVFKLGHWNKNADVDDPYRKPFAAFETAHAEILAHCALWVQKIGA